MIKIYLDTNMLENRNGENIVLADKILSSTFYQVLSYVLSNTLIKQNVKIVLAKVCIDEIKQHIKETFDFVEKQILDCKKQILEVLRSFNDNQNFVLPYSNDDAVNKLDDEINKLIEDYDFIQQEEHSNDIRNIYKMAVSKTKPFYSKKSPKNDAGFKDALLLQTIKEHFDNETILLCTKDGDFGDSELYICKYVDEIKRFINSKIEGLRPEDKVLNFLSQEYIKNRIFDEVCNGETGTINLKSYYNSNDANSDEINTIEIEIQLANGNNILATYNVDIENNEIDLIML